MRGEGERGERGAGEQPHKCSEGKESRTTLRAATIVVFPPPVRCLFAHKSRAKTRRRAVRTLRSSRDPLGSLEAGRGPDFHAGTPNHGDGMSRC